MGNRSKERTSISAAVTRCRLLCILILLGFLLPVSAETESEIKAYYLVKIAQVQQWPASAFTGPKSPIIIGVLDRGLVEGDLRKYSGELAQGRPIEIRRVSANAPRELRACHIIFVAAPGRPEFIADAVDGHPVIVVGDAEGFAKRGGAIGFIKDGDNIRFDVNTAAASRGGVVLNSKLVRIARLRL